MDKGNSFAILIALESGKGKLREAEEYLDELEFLALTAGISSVQRYIQKLPHPDVKTFVGKGKFEEIKQFAFENNVDHLIFDDDLSPSQLRNIERELNPASRDDKIRIYDRSLLILDIFVQRAQTAQARTQVDLAMFQYLLPRLTRLWTHLERQRGGTGTRGGAGEKEIETDRRTIRNRISVLKQELERIDKQRKTQRKSRNNIVRVSIVGYTNAGKSTLMNLLSKAKVKAENKLFATVDSTVRKVVLKNIPFLLSDTVGFIRKLPHHLIESFKSTLDEVRESDLLLHLVDVANPSYENHIDVVSKTLKEIGVGEVPVILVLNKSDLMDEADREARLRNIKLYHNENGFESVVFVSAETRENLDELRSVIVEEVMKRHMKIYPNYVKPSSIS